jgi:hypothetical protein
LSVSIWSVPTVVRVIFPLDERWQLNPSLYSNALALRMVWLGALLSYQHCQAVWERIAERRLPSSSIWKQVQRHGDSIEAYVEQQREQVSVERVVLPDLRHDHHEPKLVSIDGGFVNILGEGWRELKVGAVSDLEIRLERNPQTQDLDEIAHGVNVHYTAVLGSKDAFTPALWALAVERDVPTARKRATIGDGAVWIWNVAEDVCPDGRQIVDWFHAVEHLSKASHALYPNEKDEKKRKRWLKTYKEHLYMGHIHKIIATLTKHGRPDFATYFERHQRRMQYQQFREEGLPIGSGTIESGVKQFKHRLCGTGMRWEESNANQMLTIRSAVLSNQFDALWQNATLH